MPTGTSSRPRNASSRRALRLVIVSGTLPKTAVTPSRVTSGIAQASAMAKASSTPGSVSMISGGMGSSPSVCAAGHQVVCPGMTSMWGSPVAQRLRSWRRTRRDPMQARFLTLDSLRWVLRNRAYTPWYLVRYWRLLKFRIANPHIILRGMLFLGKDVEIHCRPGYGRLEIGRWVHIGDGNAIRCHEGSLRI